MTSSTSENIIRDGSIGRAVFQNSDWKKVQKGSVPVSIFRAKQDPIRISVFIFECASNDVLTQIADELARQRGDNRSFYGWAELSVTDASANQREVHATPQPTNKCHADIMLPATAEENKKEREKHAEQLAQQAIARERMD